MANSDDSELNSFLGKVDEIESLVKELNAPDNDIVKLAMEKADAMIAENNPDAVEVEGIQTTTGFSRTVINTLPDTTVDPSIGPEIGQETDQSGFMAVLEADAQERAARRRARGIEADKIKELGNAEFKEGRYEAALDFYTQAIQKVKDCMALYTNRAQTYIKLGRFNEALTDCDWALRVSPQCLKAYIHAGRAHLGLKEYDKAREFYEQALEKDPKREAIIKEYLAEVTRAEQTQNEEQTARALFESGDQNVQGLVETLKKVNTQGHLPLFYSGGFRVIASLITATEDRTLFRTNGGLTLARDHPVLSRCLSVCPASLSGEERDVLVAALDMWTHACSLNDANQEQLMELPNFTEHLLTLMEVKLKGQGRMVKTACISLIFTLSMECVGRRVICTKFDLSRLLACLFQVMLKSGAVAIKAVSVLNNLALEKIFRVKMRDVVDKHVFPIFHKLAHSDTCQAEVVTSCVTTLINLAGDTHIRKKMANCRELWDDCIHLLARYGSECTTSALGRDAVKEVLGLLMNITVDASSNLHDLSSTLTTHCMELCNTESICIMIIERSLGLLSHVLPKSKPAVELVCQKEGPKIFLKYIKSEQEMNKKTALKCLTACTQMDNSACSYVVNNKGLGCLAELLRHQDEIVVGNAALCLSHCVLVPKAAKVMVKTDVIKDLLILARDGKRPEVQQNCAILIAKLAQGDSSHLERLRELHGIEILHSCMKYIK